MTNSGERPAELADIQGAWRRDGRTFDGSPWNEVTDVLWVQAGHHFCDLRTPLPRTAPTHMFDQPQAFSGTVQLSGGYISFHHDLDSLNRDPNHPDQGTVHRLGDAMYERGPGFEERWVVASLPGDDAFVAEWSDAGGHPAAPIAARIVRVGPLAIAVWGGPLAGGTQFHRRHGWEPGRSWRYEGAPVNLIEAAQALGFGDPLPVGWTVVSPTDRPT